MLWMILKLGFGKFRWYVLHPYYWSETIYMIFNEFWFFYQHTARRRKFAREWCEPWVINKKFKPLDAEIDKKEIEHHVSMGGGLDTGFIYHFCEVIQARKVLETGVAHGWSSFAVLSSIKKRGGILYSIDKPYPRKGCLEAIGDAVPERFKSNWKLIIGTDRKELRRVVENGPFDICIYDSNKTYYGRMFAYPLMWGSLREGGYLISDDIGDNLAFSDFCEKVDREPLVYKSDGRYIGVIQK